ncbi:hypothetical protein AAVH_33994, partial [Aphelenchoides avenae]
MTREFNPQRFRISESHQHDSQRMDEGVRRKRKQTQWEKGTKDANCCRPIPARGGHASFGRWRLCRSTTKLCPIRSCRPVVRSTIWWIRAGRAATIPAAAVLPTATTATELRPATTELRAAAATAAAVIQRLWPPAELWRLRPAAVVWSELWWSAERWRIRAAAAAPAELWIRPELRTSAAGAAAVVLRQLRPPAKLRRLRPAATVVRPKLRRSAELRPATGICATTTDLLLPPAADVSSSSTDIPGTGSATDIPGSSTNVSGSPANLSGSPANLPGSSADVPGSSADVPGSSTDIPGSATDLPGASPADLPSSPTNVPGPSSAASTELC